MADAVVTEVADGTAVITINRPEVRNAVNGEVARGMAAAIDEFDARDDVRVLVLTGAGGSFCAGMDLKGFLAGDAPVAPGRGFAGITERPPLKPVIAAVEGYALAGGFEIVLACDLVVASDAAHFGLPEVRRGLVAGAGGLLRLARRVPYHLAMEIVLSGEHFPAARLAEAGLVSRSYPRARPLPGPGSLPPASLMAHRSRWPPASGSSWSPRTGTALRHSPCRARSSMPYSALRTRSRAPWHSPRSALRSGVASNRRRSAGTDRHPVSNG